MFMLTYEYLKQVFTHMKNINKLLGVLMFCVILYSVYFFEEFNKLLR